MHPVKYEALVTTFEKMTGIYGSWTMPEFAEKRKGFVDGFQAAIFWLADQHKSECKEDRPVQHWIKSWGKA